MEYKFEINNVQKDVHVERVGSGFLVKVDGREYTVTDALADRGRLYFSIGQRTFTGLISCTDKGVAFSIGGRYYGVEESPADKDRPTTTHVGHGRLEAPMPGNIVSINVEVGDDVSKGSPLIVLESMKMQNEIMSPFDGTVERITCAPGEQVGFGQVLAEIAPKAGP